jgi:hypothetical protein
LHQSAWDDVLNTLKSLNSKVGRCIIQLMKAEDAAREEFEYQNRRNARNEVHGLNLKDEYTSRKKKKKKHEEEEEEDEFVFQAEIECHWGNSRSDLKYLVERVR